jgi:hypothetical protein
LAATFDEAEKVSVVVAAPGAAMTLAGNTCTVMPVGNPETASVIAALKVEFGAVVIVKLLDEPGAMLMEVAGAVSVNVGAGATVTDSETLCVTDPPATVTVKA